MKKGIFIAILIIAAVGTVAVLSSKQKTREPAPEVAEGKEIKCLDDQRKADVCVQIYAPVCATVQIQCIKAPCYPIEQTFSNPCEACRNSLVETYTEGECK